MAGKTIDLTNIITPDKMATMIAERWYTWNNSRTNIRNTWEEVRRYVYATDTTQTTNAKLPWNNKTTIPKLCQIHDNLYANYMATLMPKRKSIVWEGADRADETKQKADAIKDYMTWCVENPRFKQELGKCIDDYINYGNAIAMPVWIDDRIEDNNGTKSGYVGPGIQRISPFDIVFNPIAPSFVDSPKIVRSIMTMGELKKTLESISKDEVQQAGVQELFDYMKRYRKAARDFTGELRERDDYMRVDGFDSFRRYLESGYIEVLHYYGDIYDVDKDELLQNQLCVIVDRHKMAYQGTHPSIFGKAPIYKVGWRERQDNLWSMGPLENLVGMQYRIDHIENLKADLFDLTAFPPLKVKGYVEDFEWGPFERIYISEEGDVAPVQPDMSILQVDNEIGAYEAKMEEMAGSPKEAMGFRTPGEKTKYEVQRLENAASRIFSSKINQFDEQFVEMLLNGMLEIARRNMDSTVIRVLDDEFKMAVFRSLTAEDISGIGRIRPIGARHFAEQAELVQNMTNFFGSAIGADQDIKMHFSSIKLAKMMEEILEIENYELVTPYVRLTEQADAQKMANANQEEVMTQAQTPAGIAQGDTLNA